MTMPTKTKTWLFDVNNEIIQSSNTNGLKRVIFALKEALVATGFWTVVRSSDSVSVANSDLWIDFDDLVCGRMSTFEARSWAILRHADFFGEGVPFDLLLEYGAGSVAATWPRHFRFCVSPSGDYSGGSITISPTATHEILLGVAATNSDTASFTPGIVGGVIPMVWHLMWSDDGQCFRYIMCQEGVPTAVILIDRMKNPVAGLDDVDTFVAFVKPDGDYDNPTEKLRLENFNAAAGCKSFVDAAALEVTYYMTCEYFGSRTIVDALVAGNPDDGGAWLLAPIGLVTVTAAASAYGRNAEMYDLWWGAAPYGTGYSADYEKLTNSGITYPDDESRTFVQFGDMVFPWNGSKVQMS